MFKKPFEFGFEPVQYLRLKEVEKLIRQNRIISPAPCRQTLINWIEEGVLDGHLTKQGYYVVTEKSFREWVRDLAQAVTIRGL